MLANELRQRYIDFFTGKAHKYLPGAPLIPVDALGNADNSTLFTSAGMQQFKPFFIGAATPPVTRICTVQKCLRTGDLDSVGDFSHCTFFEMLGNFSFGDYFKADVIPWTWQFLTEEIGLDPERLCVTVYLDDDEAWHIWHDVVGLPEDRIHRLGEDKNYWPANAISEGPDGPCGPCSEIFYRVVPLDQMTMDSKLTPVERYIIDDAAGRWLEIWNNVFTQFDRSADEKGSAVLTALPNKNNDTGAGLDRIVMVLQGKRSVFETDLFQPAIQRIEEISGKQYGGTMNKTDIAFRVVAEHARSMTFCIADGILPSNEGRGYVLRRIMRRAIRFGRSAMGFEETFLDQVIPCVIDQMGFFYPELTERREHILRTAIAEEERFRRTLDNGISRLEEILLGLDPGARLTGTDAFQLYDTFGFPLELTEEICAEKNVKVDIVGFNKAMEEQRERSREATGLDRDVFKNMGAAMADIQKRSSITEFLGYDQTAESNVKVLGILRDGELVQFAQSGDVVEIVLDRTPFYAESGGQVGDTGQFYAQNVDTAIPMRAQVNGTRKVGGIFLHAVRILEGEICNDMLLSAVVDASRRRNIMRNHTATHLLQSALREVLGSHVHQKGSLVAPERLRFDFTHTQPIFGEELARIEKLVNERILEDTEVAVHSDVPIAEAKVRGAMALFGEKYGEFVRIIEIQKKAPISLRAKESQLVSLELCGGTHVGRTSQIGLFKVTSETGVASGVRRIEAVTGQGAFEYILQREATLEDLANLLKTNSRDVLTAAEKLLAQRSHLEKQIQKLRTSESDNSTELIPKDLHGITVIAAVVPHADADSLAALADRAVKVHGSLAVILGTELEGRVVFVAKVTPDLIKKGVNAGKIIREVAKVAGGGGGGRPDFAQAGGKDPSRLEDAINKAVEIIAGLA